MTSAPSRPLPDEYPATPIFDDLGPRALARLRELSVRRSYKAGEIVVADGADDRFLYILRRGRVRVAKAGSGGKHTLNRLGPGETFGEMKIAVQRPASADVIAEEDVEAIAVDLDRLREEPDDSGLREALLHNVGQILSDRLRRSSERTVDALDAEIRQVRLRESAGHFIVYLFTIMSAFAFFVATMNGLGARRPRQDLVSALVIVASALPVAVLLRRSPFPPAMYGLTLARWRRVAWEAVLYTLPFLAVLTLAKALWLGLSPAAAGHALLEPFASARGGMTLPQWCAAVTAYCLLSGVQEFFARSGLQASMRLFDPRAGAETNWRVILTANLIFASAHAYLGVRFMLAAFLPGLFWGWLFERQRSLVGAAVSHALVGTWALFVVRLQGIVGGT